MAKRLLLLGLAVVLAVGMTVCVSATEPQLEFRLLQVHSGLTYSSMTAH